MRHEKAAFATTSQALDAPLLNVAVVADPAVRATSPNRLVELLKGLGSLPAMLAVFLVGEVFYEVRRFFVDPDVWWHIKVGQDILHSHRWPTVDPYSFTAANSPWIAYEWLGEVALALVARLGGNTALFALLFFSTA